MQAVLASFNRSVALNAFATHSVPSGRTLWSALSIAQSRSMPLPPELGRIRLRLRHFQSLSRAQCLCHLDGEIAPELTILFQSLSRAQCLCHHIRRRRMMRRSWTFNLSVALNPFATHKTLSFISNIDAFNR